MDRVTLVAAIPLFEEMTREEVASLSTRLEEREFPAGQDVFHQGEEGSTLFIIQEGAVQICLGEGKAMVVLRTLHAGQYFGELSLLDGAPRSATAHATKKCVLLALDRDDFVEFVKRSPNAAVSIMTELGERMRQTNELMSRQVSRNIVEEVDEKLSFGDRIADRVAAFGGSWGFIGTFAGIMLVWMVTNVAALASFDPYPFILLNLVLSSLAALQAPIIMMSQNRQSIKDKLLAENDFEVNLKSEMGIEQLLKGQAELLARVGLLERASGPRPPVPGRAEISS